MILCQFLNTIVDNNYSKIEDIRLESLITHLWNFELVREIHNLYFFILNSGKIPSISFDDPESPIYLARLNIPHFLPSNLAYKKFRSQNFAYSTKELSSYNFTLVSADWNLFCNCFNSGLSYLFLAFGVNLPKIFILRYYKYSDHIIMYQ